MNEWNRCPQWTQRLEFVLNDRTALDAFRDWLKMHHNQHPLELHFALRSFERMANERDERAMELAQIIYEKYISSRTGVCSFFPTKSRNEVALRVSNLSPSIRADSSIFEPLILPLDAHLRVLHEAFVSSDHFIDAFNQFTIGGEDRRRRKHSGHVSGTQLTAEALLMSRDVREHAESSLERMFGPSRLPYVGRPTTSHNDSAVSSSFSGASGDQRHRLRSIREGQLRAQPQTYTVPRVEPWRENEIIDHMTEEGRRQFAEKLSKRLQKELSRRRRNDDTERQLRDIADRKCTAREAISDFAQEDDEDDELDHFLERMGDGDSVKASAQRSPRGALLSPSEWKREPQRSVERREMTLTRPAQGFSSYKDRRQVIYDSSGIESNAPSGFSNLSNTSGASRTSRSSAQRRLTGRKLLTISYKGPDGVPVVAHVQTSTGTLTLKEFRRQFSISSHDPVQFFFKTTCEDDSAPYQLLLIQDDSQQLPVFDGRVTAELKSRSPQ